MKITRISITLRSLWSPRTRGSSAPLSMARFRHVRCESPGGLGPCMYRGDSRSLRGWRLIARYSTACLILAAIFLFQALVERDTYAEKIYAPEYLWKRGIAEKTDAKDIADAHLGIRYRNDGTLDSHGRFTTFEEPTRFFGTPGLNCSGLVLSICRFVYDKNWMLEEVMRDPQGNSGAGSALGKDWDFGLDLISNLTARTTRRGLMPDGRQHSIEEFDGLNARGFDLRDRAAWQKVIGQMRPGRAYLASISKISHKPGYQVLHYHVVIMLPDDRGNVWLYHATHLSNVHRMNMSSPKGLGRFIAQFSGSGSDQKRIIVLESELPHLVMAADSTSKPSERPTALDTVPGTSSAQRQAAPASRTDAKKSLQEDLGLSSAVEGLPKTGEDREGGRLTPGAGTDASPRKDAGPDRVINHLAGKVFKAIPGISTAIPRFADEGKKAVRFWFRNGTPVPRAMDIVVKGPDGEQRFTGKLETEGSDVEVRYPTDFGNIGSQPLQLGRYTVDVRLDGVPWLADVFEVAVPREAKPKIVKVSAPSTVRAGQGFTVKIEAVNSGAESDYGGITVSTPDPSGLRLRSATPGRVFSAGSTVLSVTSDRIRTKVPMAERWIELWGENATYDMTVKINAGRPGRYALFIRCALRGVNVKSSVILMDPKSSKSVDQQGFPVYVHYIEVQ